MDKKWLARLRELEARLAAAARELLDHSGSASTQLELEDDVREDVVVFVGPKDHFVALNSPERDWKAYREGEPLPDEVRDALPPEALGQDTKH